MKSLPKLLEQENNMFSINDFAHHKQEQQKITMVTAYDYFSAKLVEAAGIDTILVGDSLGMVFAGNDNTLAVSLEEMIYHAKAVKKGAPNSFIVVDMPYMSYHVSIDETIRNAGRIIQQSNANALKLEINNRSTLAHIEALINAQIPVIGHIGLTPQSVNVFGGFKIQGNDDEDADKIIAFAHKLAQIGVSAIVLECIPSDLAEKISNEVNIATIGIGSGSGCDGQVLVFYDLLGFNPNNKLKFVKQYTNAHECLVQGLKDFSQEVTTGIFPNLKHSYLSSNSRKK